MDYRFKYKMQNYKTLEDSMEENLKDLPGFVKMLLNMTQKALTLRKHC